MKYYYALLIASCFQAMFNPGLLKGSKPSTVNTPIRGGSRVTAPVNPPLVFRPLEVPGRSQASSVAPVAAMPQRNKAKGRSQASSVAPVAAMPPAVRNNAKLILKLQPYQIAIIEEMTEAGHYPSYIARYLEINAQTVRSFLRRSRQKTGRPIFNSRPGGNGVAAVVRPLEVAPVAAETFHFRQELTRKQKLIIEDMNDKEYTPLAIARYLDLKPMTVDQYVRRWRLKTGRPKFSSRSAKANSDSPEVINPPRFMEENTLTTKQDLEADLLGGPTVFYK